MPGELEPAELCRRHGSSILRRCRAILGDPHEAEDAAQEVFLTILSKGEQFLGAAALSTWIYRVTTNVCLNRLRAHSRRKAREQSDAVRDWADLAPSDPYQRYVARATLESLLASLDELGQEILILHHLDGLTQDEIAQVTGRSRRTVGKRLAAIAKALEVHS